MWRHLRDLGAPILSTWIDETGPGEIPDRGAFLSRCFHEVLTSERLILYAEPGDPPLEIALGEACVAMAAAIPVYVVAPGVSDAALGFIPSCPTARRVDTVGAAFVGLWSFP